MTLTLSMIGSTWACIYTLSLARALWKQANYRGAVGVGLLAILVLVVPFLIQTIGRR